MKNLLYIAAFALTTHSVHAEDLSFAFEGDRNIRGRLSALQGTGEPPALRLSGWENSSELSLADLKGKIVVLDFWATWCGPCIASIPHNNKIHEKYKEDVVFIGVCHPQGAEKMKEVIKNKGIKYPTAIDPNSETIKAYKVNGYPDYYVIDRDGSLVVADCANSKIDRVLAKLLEK